MWVVSRGLRSSRFQLLVDLTRRSPTRQRSDRGVNRFVSERVNTCPVRRGELAHSVLVRGAVPFVGK